ncbi:MAG: hypothetical protein K6E68_04810 [Lachnospiraceae bacterium]|nr:hypothetical protein [Lachnospiraceae bacterium]
MGVAIFFGILIFVAIRLGSKSGLGLSGLLDPTYRNNTSQSKSASVSNPPTTIQKSPVAIRREPAVTASNMRKEAPVNRLMDDREHDWLAGQLRDERAAKRRMSDMFDLKMEHTRSCEAEMLRDFHSSNCDAEGIDTAKA